MHHTDKSNNVWMSLFIKFREKQMTFSRYKTIAGVSAYQHQSIKRKRDNASLLIPTKDVALKDSTNYASQLDM